MSSLRNMPMGADDARAAAGATATAATTAGTSITTTATASSGGRRALSRMDPHARSELVARACRRMEAAESPPTLKALAADSGLSPWQFHRLFMSETGLTPRAYAAGLRARRLREALAAGNSAVTEAIYEAGYNASSRFYETSDSVLGMRASEYRTGAAGQRISFAVGQCCLGAILVAESERGICAILLGDDPDDLVRDLHHRFPAAELAGGDPDFEERVARVVAFVETPSTGIDLPLDIRGTAFQERVWRALRAIPPGTTITYGELAKRIGAPEAVRAVAGACGANRLAVAIPCHRVVRLNGDLGGYRWGIEKKQMLLDRERRQSTER